MRIEYILVLWFGTLASSIYSLMQIADTIGYQSGMGYITSGDIIFIIMPILFSGLFFVLTLSGFISEWLKSRKSQ